MHSLNEEHYGSDTDTFSYLEFGGISPAAGRKKVYDFYTHAKAYDWFMLGRYANDLRAYVEMASAFKRGENASSASLYRAEVHHADDLSSHLSKGLALGLFRDPSFLELGQTIFGCIEGIEACRGLLQSLAPGGPMVCDPATVSWNGKDISRFFNVLAVQLHHGYNVRTSDSWSDLSTDYSLFFAKGVTLLYAVRTVEDFFDLVGKAEFSIVDYSLSLGGSRHGPLGTGKEVCYLGATEFLAALERQSREFWVRESTLKVHPEEGRVYFEGCYGGGETQQEFRSVDKAMREKIDIEMEQARAFFPHAAKDFCRWVPLKEVLTRALDGALEHE
jgi:hypothetical protein